MPASLPALCGRPPTLCSLLPSRSRAAKQPWRHRFHTEAEEGEPGSHNIEKLDGMRMDLCLLILMVVNWMELIVTLGLFFLQTHFYQRALECLPAPLSSSVEQIQVHCQLVVRR